MSFSDCKINLTLGEWGDTTTEEDIKYSQILREKLMEQFPGICVELHNCWGHITDHGPSEKLEEITDWIENHWIEILCRS